MAQTGLAQIDAQSQITEMNQLKESISPAVLAEAEVAVEARPINEASNFFSFRQTDEHTGQTYWFFLDSPENVHQIKFMPTGLTRIGAGSNETWYGEKIGTLELAELPFVAFKVFATSLS